jgi:hypothetical protein
MTRKDYVLIAGTIRQQIAKNYLHAEALTSSAIELADGLARDNPARFDRRRFLSAACAADRKEVTS